MSTNPSLPLQQGDIVQQITHFNIPQQKAWIVNANTTVAILGRATGKDHGVVTPIQLRNVKGMPRGATAFISPTYVKAKNDTIPALGKAFEKFGFYEDIDFWVGKYIPVSVKHEKAYEHPRDPEYSIFWRNGHITRIIGLDNKKSANGQSNDFIILNEARFIKYSDFISRVKPTNRGNEDLPHFAKLHYHHGMLIASDMVRNSESQWLLDFEKSMDPTRIDLIVSFDQEERRYIKHVAKELMAIDPELPATLEHDKEQLLQVMRSLVLKRQLTEALEKRFRKELQRLDNILFTLRRTAVYCIRASTLDNIDVVRPSYIEEMFRDLSPREFKTSILNIQDNGTDEPFYSNFNTEQHTYDDINYDYLELFENADIPQPWKKDGDLDTTKSLQVALDFNKKMTCMEIGQEAQHVFKFVNSLYVKDPQRIKHLAKRFDEYYVGYPTKKVVHHYDHNATGQDASREISYADEFRQELCSLGWIVAENYIGRAPTHASRHKLFLRVYAEDDPDTKPIRINSTNCRHSLDTGSGYGGLIPSLENCGSYESPTKGIQKDKKPELSSTYPPEQAPHHSDAHDTLYIGVFQDRLGEATSDGDYTI